MASILARRAKAAANPARTPAPRSLAAKGSYKTVNGKTVFVPSRPGGMPPAGEGTIVKTADGISIMMGGKLQRLGSSKCLSLSASGQVVFTAPGGWSTPIWPKQLGAPDRGGVLVGTAGKMGLISGRLKWDLETGKAVEATPEEILLAKGKTAGERERSS
jgi:hypothetical protein